MSETSAPLPSSAAPPWHGRGLYTLTRMLAISGYGVWLLLGLSLAVGVYPAGRGDALVPLTWGALLIGVAPLLACLHTRALPDWLGWRFGRGSRPTAEGLVALGSFLPAMAVAGLARGDNLFWATRLSAAALALACLVSLVFALRLPRADTPFDRRAVTASAARILAAVYTGGLWLWLCAAAQQGDEGVPGSGPWLLVLPLAAMGTGVLDARRWRKLWQWSLFSSNVSRKYVSMHVTSVILVYAVPTASLLAAWGGQALWPAAVAAVSCVLGKSLEQHLYHVALARSGAHLSPA